MSDTPNAEWAATRELLRELPKSGLHRGIDFDTYARWPAANFSSLKHFRRSAAHARYEQTHQSDTSAKVLGQAVHVALLEPERFAATYVGAPELDRRTVAGKAAWIAFQGENADRIVLKADEMADCLALSRAAQEHPVAGALLQSAGHREVSLLWHDADTGLDCKARPDLFVKWDGYSTIVDFKTTRDASPSGFAIECARFSYHLQAAWYLAGADAISPVARRFVFVAIEKSPPHCIGIYELDSADLDAGRAAIRECLHRYKRARETGEWPGYSTQTQTLRLPAWATQIHEEDT